MPIYAFQCAQCGHAFDRLQKLSDADPTACPQCGAEAVSRQLTAPQFRLAGGGWYETDFKGEGKRNLAGEAGNDAKSGDGAAKSDTTAASTGDAKPAAKSDAPAAPAKPQTPAKAAESKPASTPKSDG